MVVLVALGAPAVVAAQAVWLGAWTQIWPWMWEAGKGLEEHENLKPYDRMRWEFALANLAKAGELGAKWNVVVLRQGRDGADQWKRAAAIVEAQRGMGIETVFRLIENPGLYRALRDGGTAAQNALGEYEAWVSGLARVFSGRVPFYLISNEIDHNFGANLLSHRSLHVEFAQYRRVLDVAYRVIKAEDPGAYVVDHGVSSYSLGLAVAAALREKEGVVAAYDFWKRFLFDRADQAGSLFDFERMMVRDGTVRRIAIAEQTFSSGKYCDFHQMHWYFNPDVLPDVLAWIRRVQRNSGYPRSLLVSELGYRMPTKRGRAWDGRPANVADWGRYSEQQHAASLVKSVALLLGHGVRHIQYWQLRVHHQRDASAQLYYPTVDPAEFIPTAASAVLRRFARSSGDDLRGAACSQRGSLMRCDLTFSYKAYQVLWMLEGRQIFDVPPAAVAVYDASLNQQAPTRRLTIDNNPVIIEFKGSTNGG